MQQVDLEITALACAVPDHPRENMTRSGSHVVEAEPGVSGNRTVRGHVLLDPGLRPARGAEPDHRPPVVLDDVRRDQREK